MSGDTFDRSACRHSLVMWDHICDRFEQDWRAGNHPRIEDHLAQLCGHDVSEALADLLTIELSYRRQRGEQPRLEEYDGRFPAQADFLKGYFLAGAANRPPETISRGNDYSRPAADSLGYAVRDESGRISSARTERWPIDDGGEGGSRPSGDDLREEATMRDAAVEPADVAEPPLPEVPGYELLGVLGRGGMGVVYLARNTRLGRCCALKMISAPELATREQSTRFLAEATTLARLRHPLIVQVHHVGEHAGRPYFELEYVEGGNLAARLDGTPWPADQAARLAESLAVAIQEAHHLGIVHRDLKPGNILITAVNQPKISDFGLARLLGGGSDLTQSEAILGTPSYMAPEQASGHAREAGPPADVYSLGAILYELLTGRPPFKGANPLETLEQVKTIEPVAPCRLVPGLPRDLETICLTCLQKAPERRYETAGALEDDLTRYRLGEPIHARRSGWAEHAWKWCRRNPTRALLTTVSAVLLLSLTVGPAVTSLVWMRERDNARLARHEAAEQRREAYAAQARSLRQSGQPGGRFQALAVLSDAARIRPGPDLRDEAIACMGLIDLRVAREWPIHLPSFSRPAADWPFERYAVSDDQGNLAIRSLVDDRLIQSLPGSGKRCQAMQFSHDGKFLAAQHDDHEFYFWDLAQGEALPWITGEVTAWAFSSDGRVVAIGRGNNSISLYTLADGRLLRRLALEDVPVSLDFSPDGQTLAAACGKVITLMETAAGRPTRRLLHESGVRRVRWGAGGKLLFSLASGPSLRTWEAHGWRLAWSDRPIEVETLKIGRRTRSEQLAVSPDGTMLAVDWVEGMRLLDAWSGEHLLTIPGSLTLGSEAFSPDGRRLLCLSADHSSAELWEVGRGPEFRQAVAYAGEDGGVALSVDFHPGDHLLAVGERRGARLVDPDSSSDLAWLQSVGTETVRFRPDGLGFAAAGYDGLAYWSVGFHDEGRNRQYVVGPPRELHPRSSTSQAARVAWGPAGRFLAWSDRPRGEVVIEDPEGRTPRRVISGIPNLRGLAVSPDGRWLATWPWNGVTLEVRDLVSEQVVWSRRGNLGRALFSPDARRLVTTMDDTVSFYETGSWQILKEIPCPAAGTMAFSPDGNLLAVNSAGGLVLLLNPATGETLARLQNPSARVDRFHLSFSSDGSLLAMANGRRGVQVWDLKQVRQTLRAIGLDLAWPEAETDTAPKVLAMAECHEPKYDATQAEHTGDWTRAIPLRTARSGSDPSQLHRRGHCFAQLGRWPDALTDFEAVSQELGGSLAGHVGSLGAAEEHGSIWRPVIGRWHQVALTFDDASGISSLYIDGSSLYRFAGVRPPGFDGHPLIVGAKLEAREPMEVFTGMVSNVRMWSVARPQSEIQADLRESPTGTGPRTADLVGRWNPERAGTGTLVDTSGHHHDGRLVGNVSAVPIDAGPKPPGFPACEYALRYEGSGGYVEIPDATGLRPRSFTIEGWFNFGRNDRRCWLFSRQVGELLSLSLAVSYHDEGTSEKLEVASSRTHALMASGDGQGYQRLCRRLVQQYEETTDAKLAREVSHLCSMGTAALDQFSPCVAMAERAVAAEGGHDSLSSLGAILYRSGRFADALRHLQQAVSVPGEGGTPQDQLFLAMVYHALGDDKRAREELKKTEASIPRTLELEAEKRGHVRWPDDWLVPTELRLLRAEAESLLMDSAFPVDPFP